MILLWGSCSKAPAPTSGQIFIATRDGLSIKLGAVPVLFVDTRSASGKILDLVAEDEGRAKQLRELPLRRPGMLDIEQLEARLEVYERAWLYLTVGEPDIAAALRLTGEKQTTDVKRRLDELRNKLAATRAEYFWFEERQAALAETVVGVPRCLFSTNYSALFVTTTDPDGRFSGPPTIAEGNSIIAFGSRSVGTNMEYYFWFVPVTAANRTNLLLNNQNLFLRGGVSRDG